MSAAAPVIADVFDPAIPEPHVRSYVMTDRTGPHLGLLSEATVLIERQTGAISPLAERYGCQPAYSPSGVGVFFPILVTC